MSDTPEITTESAAEKSPEAATESEERRSRFASRRGRLGACTRKINEIKALMTDVGNVDKVNDTFEAFKGAVYEFISAHESVQELLSADKRETDYDDWYEPRRMNLDYFAREVDIWKREIAQSKVGPLDSVSNVSRKSKSSISSVSSELKKAKADQAAAMARAAALKEKHTLQLEETKLKSKMEQMELDADLAASAAKIRILKEWSDVVEQEGPGDGMNDYYDSHYEPETMESNVEFMQLGAIPKTPLHQTIMSFPIPSSTSRPIKPPMRPTPENKPRIKNVTQTYKSESANHNHTITHVAQDNSNRGVNAAHDNLDVVIQRQNDIAELIVSQHNLSKLPVREISVFDGDPLAY